MSGKTEMTSRISVSPATLERFRDLTQGMKAKNYDLVVNFLIDRLQSEDDMLAGRDLREEFNAWLKEKGLDKPDKAE